MLNDNRSRVIASSYDTVAQEVGSDTSRALQTFPGETKSQVGHESGLTVAGKPCGPDVSVGPRSRWCGEKGAVVRERQCELQILQVQELSHVKCQHCSHGFSVAQAPNLASAKLAVYLSQSFHLIVIWLHSWGDGAMASAQGRSSCLTRDLSPLVHLA